MKIINTLVAYTQDKRAVTAIEYGVLAASIALGIGTIFGGESEFMSALTDTFGKITEQLKGASE